MFYVSNSTQRHVYFKNDRNNVMHCIADVEKRGPSDDTSAAVPLLEKGMETIGGWNAVYEGQMDNHLMVAVTPAADCIVASWRIDIDTKLEEKGSLSYTHPQPIYILFNPWCLNDSVYMPGKKYIIFR